MVKLNKSKLPDNIKIKHESHYQTGVVYNQLIEDCHNKCYICEHKPIPGHVEHIITHKGDPSLKYNWYNMLLSCVHCNSVKKKTEYDTCILNPIIVDPENYIILELSIINLKEEVIITSISDADEKIDKQFSIEKTCKLLNEVYNNNSNRLIQVMSSISIKNRLSSQIKDFCILVDNYKQDHNDGDYLNIVETISRKSEFAAFKRGIIRNDSELINDFSKVLNES